MQQVANRQLFEGKKEPQTLVKSGLAAFPRTRTRESMHAARPGSPARVVVLRFLFCYSRFALDERSFLILPTSGRM